jgi:L-aminopeptidase/D-esterase-like protein
LPASMYEEEDPAAAKPTHCLPRIWSAAHTPWCSPEARSSVWLRPMGSPRIPIVPSAVLHDLSNGGDKNWGRTPPYRDLGVRALEAAAAEFAMGSVGAGRGAMAGLIKGGVGSASLDLGEGLIVGALVALNSVGSALMPDGNTYWAWAFELNDEFGGGGPPAARIQHHAGCGLL